MTGLNKLIAARTIVGDLYLEDQGGQGEPVVLLWPSLFTDHTMWHPQVSALRSAGFRTLSIDPPGHGQSNGLDRPFTMDECAKAALQTLDAMKISEPVIVLGTSWGGMVAPRMALLAPNRIRGMVLFNTTATGPAPFDRLRGSLLVKLLAVGALDSVVDYMVVSLQLARETRRRNPEIASNLSKRYRSWDRRRLINAVRCVLVNRDSSLESLHGIKAPTLLVSGKEDPILPALHSLRMIEKLPNARHVDVAGVAHLVPVEAPEESNKLIHGFVSDLRRV